MQLRPLNTLTVLSITASLLAPSVARAAPPPPLELVDLRNDVGDDVGDETQASDESEAEAEAEAMPFDTVELAELESAAHSYRDDRVRGNTEQTMSGFGVEDPFPDKVERTLPRDVWIPGAVSLGLAGAALVMGRLALLPDCSRQDDINSCAVPNGGDIGVRGGRVAGAVGFGVGGAVFGAVSGRAFGHWLAENDRLSLAEKRRIANGVGTSAVVIGTIGLATGATLLGVGTRNAVDIGREFEDNEGQELTDEETARANEGLGEIRRARGGLMVLVAAPTFLATGIALLVHRPNGPRVSVAPALSRTYAGASVRVRF